MTDHHERRTGYGVPAALTSMLALSAALAAPPARAQTSFNAPDPTVVSGNVTIQRGAATPGVEVYTIQTSTAVLDFTPSDQAIGGGLIGFQNANTSVTYRNGPNVTDFTVLNRIVPVDPTRPILFSGTVISRLQGDSGGPVPGGSVWFYSPGGILIGSSAVFDIGNLLLTAADPTGGTGTIGSTTSFTAGGAPGRYVTLNPGASITAASQGSYVAMVAPQIQQAGTVRVNGSAAYVAAEQASLTINNGLFDIAVTVGSDANAGLTLAHSGSTTGPSSVSATTDRQGIYLVAVPKNTAITMLVAPTGNLGFDVASVAGVENGKIVLSAGRNIVGGNIDPATVGTPQVAANINIARGRFTSDVFGRATTDAFAASVVGTAVFDQDVTLQGARAHIAARRTGETLTVGGNATVIADDFRDGAGVDPNVLVNTQGGQALFYAENGGTLRITGNATASAEARAARGTATGGVAQLSVFSTGGTIEVDGATRLSAAVRGLIVSGGTGPGANGTGGTAAVDQNGAGQIRLRGGLDVQASGVGSPGGSPSAMLAGNGTGGVARVSTASANGGLAITGPLNVTANGTGGFANFDGLTAGNGLGGTATLSAGAGVIAVTGAMTLSANGTSGSSIAANTRSGNGQGGTAQLITLPGGTATLSGALTITSNGTGGSASGSGNGGAGTGGNAIVNGGGLATLTGNAVLSAEGVGGAKLVGGPGVGGVGTGGNASVSAFTGTVAFGANLTISTNATGGNSATGNGGSSLGGSTRVATTGAAGRITVTINATLTSSATGGNGGLAVGTVGGIGFGGNGTAIGNFFRGIFIETDAGGISFLGTATLLANGTGGAGATGGNGISGLGDITAFAGTLSISGLVTASFNSVGGAALADALAGVGGGRGGDALSNFTVLDGSETNSGLLIETFGGATTGALNIGSLILSQIATGGTGAAGVNGGQGGIGGNAQGGGFNAFAVATGRTLSIGSLVFDASATGGAGGNGAAGVAGGAGGVGQGGFGVIGAVNSTSANATSGSATFGTVSLVANGRGGTGGVGGSGAPGGAGGVGTGGLGRILGNGAPAVMGNLTITAGGVGGNGGAAGSGSVAGVGGAGVGGRAFIEARKRSQTPDRGSITAGITQMTVSGTGGSGRVAGASTAGGGRIGFVDADGNFGSLSFVADGDNAGSQSTEIEVTGGTLNVASAISVLKTGNIIAQIRDGGVLRASSLSLRATGSLLAQSTTGTTSYAPGLIEVGQFVEQIADDFELGANLTVTAGSIFVSGDRIRTENLTARDFVNVSGNEMALGNIDGNGVSVVGSIIGAKNIVSRDYVFIDGDDTRIGNVRAINDIALFADYHHLQVNGNLLAGALESVNSSIEVYASNGSITTGTMRAGRWIQLDAATSITTGDLTAATLGFTGVNGDGDVDVAATTGSITTGNISGVELSIDQGDEDAPVSGDILTGNLTAEKISVSGLGAITLGDVTASDLYPAFSPPDGLQLVLAAVGDLRTGAVTGQGTLILGSLNGSVTTGALTTPTSALVLAARNVSLGGVTTGRAAGDALFVSNSTILGDPLLARYNDFEIDDVPFDRALLLRLQPTRIGGALSISGPVSTGHVRVAANAATLSAIDASQRIELDIAGLATLDDTLVAGGDVLIGAGQLRARDIRATGNLVVTTRPTTASPGEFRTGALESNTGSVTVLNAAGGLTTGAVRAAQTIDLQALGNIATGDMTAGRVGVRGGAAVTVGNIVAREIRAGLGAPDGHQVVVVAGGDLRTGSVTSQDFVVLASRNGSVTATGNVSAVGSAVILASQNVTLAGIASGTGAGGSVYVSNTSLFTTDPRLADYADFDSETPFDDALLRQIAPTRLGGALSISGAVVTGNFRAAASAITLAGVTASQRVDLNAGGLASFNGLVAAPRIDVRSSDIDIAAGGGLGTAQTQTITLTGGGGPLLIGGDGGGQGYRLGNAEAQRLRAGRIDIVADSGTGAPPAIMLRDLTLAGSAAGQGANLVADGASLNISTGGTIRIEGAVTINGMGANDRLTLSAGTRIENVTDLGGSIALLGAQVAQGQPAPLGGTLLLSAPVILSGSNSLLTQIVANPRFAGRDALLNFPTGRPQPEGFIQARRIELRATDLIAIQNSGSGATAAGFTAGAGGMLITNGVTAPNRPDGTGTAATQGPLVGGQLEVVINGRVQTATGFATNADTRNAITVNVAQGTLAANSAVNGCLFNLEECFPVRAEVSAEIAAEISALLDGVLQSDPAERTSIPTIRLINVLDQEGLVADPLITEPVAGAGNPGLWEREDEDEDEDEGDEATAPPAAAPTAGERSQ